MDHKAAFYIRGRKYHVLKELKISKDGLSGVYQVLESGLNRKVLIRWSQSSLQRQFRVLQRISKNNRSTPALIDYCKQKKKEYIILEWVEGSDLSEYFEERKKGNPKFLWSRQDSHKVILNLARDLNRFHQERVMHGDIKPANIIVKHNPLRLMFIDFGISWAGEWANERPQELTRMYGAPEQYTDDLLIDHRSDQFSLSVILYELITEKLPYGSGSEAARYSSIPKLKPVSNWPSLNKVLEKSLSINPSDRFGTTRQFVSALIDSAPKNKPAGTLQLTDFDKFIATTLNKIKGLWGRK